MNCRIEVELSRNDQLMTMKFFGSITFRDLEESYRLRVEYADGSVFPSLKVLLMDYTDAETSQISTDDVKHDLLLAETYAPLNPSLSIIGVLPHPLGFGNARMWSMLGSDLPWTIYSCKTLAEADAIMERIFSGSGQPD